MTLGNKMVRWGTAQSGDLGQEAPQRMRFLLLNESLHGKSSTPRTRHHLSLQDHRGKQEWRMHMLNHSAEPPALPPPASRQGAPRSEQRLRLLGRDGD